MMKFHKLLCYLFLKLTKCTCCNSVQVSSNKLKKTLLTDVCVFATPECFKNSNSSVIFVAKA